MPRPSRSGIRGLYRDADGRYRIDLRYTDPAGVERRHKERLPEGTPALAARARATDVLTMALAGKLHERGEDAPTGLRSAFDEYRRLTAPANPKQRERHCKVLLAAFGDVALAEVNELAIERFKRARATGKSPSTVNRELQTLRHFLNCAVEWRWLEARPKVRMFKEPPGRVRWLSDGERARLYGALPARFKRVVLAAALSGQRLANVIGMRRADVDTAARSISIPKTKSGKRHDVPMSDALAVVIAEAIADGDAQAKRREVDPPAHVFVSRFGKPYTSSGVSGLFRKCVADAAVKDFRFHDLRHDFATRVRRAGHGLDVVQALLGHSTPAMTARYAHIGRSELHEAVSAVAARAGGEKSRDVAPGLPPGRVQRRAKRRK